MSEFVVSVLAADRPGIVAAVSGAAAELGGNITHLSETVLRGYFTIIFIVETPDNVTVDQIREAVKDSGGGESFQVGALPFQEEQAAALPAESTEQFVLTARCKDRKGVIHDISQALAKAGINIADFYAYIVGDELIMVLELDVNAQTEVAVVQDRLETLARDQEIIINFQHKDIFRATTELQAVLRLGDKF